MDDYTPTTEEVERACGRYLDSGAFQRWLAERDREVAERAWDEVFNRGYDLMVVESAQKPYAPDLRNNPYRLAPVSPVGEESEA